MVEKRTKTSVSLPSAKTPALQTLAAAPLPRNTPWAPAPRAWTTRSGMRSLSKCVIFSRRWWSCRRTGPRRPAFIEWSVSDSRAPCAVVRYAPCCRVASSPSFDGAPVGLCGVAPF